MLRQRFGWLLLVGLALIGLAACSSETDDDSVRIPRNAVAVRVLANSSIAPWLTEAATRFNDEALRTPDNQRAFVVVDSAESGSAIDLLSTNPDVTLWVPENTAWADVLAQEGMDNFTGSCQSVVSSPLVIGMWQPVAAALGWPGRELGWLDIGSLAADSTAWAYYSGGQFGDELRIGHTHPGISGSGASTLLAIVEAAQGADSGVTVAELQEPIVQASVASFESAVSWFSPSTDTLARTMRERGPSYLGAAVMYESDVLRYQAGDPALIPVYPFEGSFVATHPLCLNGAVSAETAAAADLFRDYLAQDDAQTLAVTFGLRPSSTSVTIEAPLSAANGVRMDEPKIRFADSTPSTLFAVQDLWQSTRQPVNLVMVIDVSGSMRGEKIDSVRSAAIQFVDQMSDEDYLTLIAFEDSPFVILPQSAIDQSRQQATSAIANLAAGGGTALYDAIGAGASLIADTNSPNAANVMVVLTDGLDTSSTQFRLNDRLIEDASANGTTVFTIAYGNDADERLLNQLAVAANGNFYVGTEASIATIYEEMSLAFGGSVGIGR